MHIDSIPLGPAQTNCYLIWNDLREALVIDPGDEAGRLLQHIEDLNLQIVSVPLTHAHIDHIGALANLVDHYAAPVGLHAADATWAFTKQNQLQPFYNPVERETKIARSWLEGQIWEDAGLTYEILFTPGHTPGGVCFYFREHNLLISGDCLFVDSIGRTDLPGGNYPVLMRTLQRLLTLPDETRVLPGHGPETTIGRERISNPFLQGIG